MFFVRFLECTAQERCDSLFWFICFSVFGSLSAVIISLTLPRSTLGYG